MSRHLHTLWIGFAMILFGSESSAQSQPRPATSGLGTLHRASTPGHVRFSLAEGVTFQDTLRTRSGPETIFDNTDGVEYYFTFFSPTEEAIDECAFAADDLDGLEQVNGFDFSYCATTTAGPTVDLSVRFYLDTVLGSGPTNYSAGPHCAYALTGLPGFVGGVSCWTASVDLDGGYPCDLPQETVPGGFTDHIGIGYIYHTNEVGPVLDSPYLPGGGYAPPGYGSWNAFEIFLPGQPNPHFGTFWWSSRKFESSFDLKLYGDGIVDTKVVLPDSSGSGDVLRLRSDVEFRPGSQVTYTLDNASAGTFGIVFASALDPLQPSIAPGVTLLLDAGSVIAPPSPALMSGGPNATFTTPVLPGLPSTVYAQAFEFSSLPLVPGNVIAGSNALKHDN